MPKDPWVTASVAVGSVHLSVRGHVERPSLAFMQGSNLSAHERMTCVLLSVVVTNTSSLVCPFGAISKVSLSSW